METESTPAIPQEEPPKKQRFLKKWMIGIILFILLSFLCVFLYSHLATRKSTVSEIITPTITPAATPTEPPDLWMFQKKVGSDYQTLFQVGALENISTLSGEIVYINTRDELHEFSLTQGRDTFLLTFHQDEKYQTDNHKKLIFFNNQLFLFAGSYWEGVEVYEVPLPLSKNEQLQKVTNTGIDSSFMRVGNHTFLVSSTGNNCGSVYSAALIASFHPFKSIPIVAHGECGGDTELSLTLDDKGQAIIATTAVTPPIGNPQGTVKNVTSISLDNPSQSTQLISDKMMPSNVYDIKYSAKYQSLFLVGKALYIYNLADKSLTKKIDLPTDWKLEFLGSDARNRNFWDEKDYFSGEIRTGAICIYHDTDQSEEYNVEGNKLIHNSASCTGSVTIPSPTPSDDVLVKAFHLPPEYRLVYK